MNDLSILSTEKAVLYQAYRAGINGFWADVPKQFFSELPEGTKVILVNNQPALFLSFTASKLTLLDDISGDEFELTGKAVPENIKCFIKSKSAVSEGSGFKLFINSVAITMDDRLVVLLVGPSVLSLIYLLALSKFSAIGMIIQSVCFAGIFLLIQAIKTDSGLLKDFFCKSRNGGGGCSKLAEVNPYKFIIFHPVVVGLSYFTLLPYIALSQSVIVVYTIGIVNALSILHLYVYRWIRGYQCTTCDYVSVVSILSMTLALIALNYRQESSDLAFGIAFLFLATIIVLYISQLIQISRELTARAPKQIKLKGLQARMDVLGKDISAAGDIKAETIDSLEKHRLYYNQEGDNDLHLVISLDCKYCKHLYLELISKIPLFSTRNLYITVQGKSLSGARSTSVNTWAAWSDVERKESLDQYFRGGISRHQLVDVSIAGAYLPVAYVPVLTVNGNIFPNIYELEDLFVYLKYNTLTKTDNTAFRVF